MTVFSWETNLFQVVEAIKQKLRTPNILEKLQSETKLITFNLISVFAI